jgi:uncharacterized membrane protein YhaH (DUF805 family)
MLRRGKFGRTEVWLVWLIALGLFAGGATGIGLAIARGDGNIGLAGAGVIALAAIYLIAAIRRRPL